MPLSQAPEYLFTWRSLLIYVSNHLFLFPASTAYNGYYDNDRKSISGYKKPEPVTRELLWVSILLEFIALLLATFVNFWFFLYVLIFALSSKLYSHPSIKLKGLPIFSWFMNTFYYGYFTCMGVLVGLTGPSAFFSLRFHFISVLMFLAVCAGVPLNQVFQYKQDKKEGLTTICHLVGIKGTFYMTIPIFILTGFGIMLFFHQYYPVDVFHTILMVHTVCLLPTVYYLAHWYRRVCKNNEEADLNSAMKVFLITTWSGIIFFSWLTIYSNLYLL